jgi:CRISPR/Cas system CMR-associated protein Cmr5 small subunit
MEQTTVEFIRKELQYYREFEKFYNSKIEEIEAIFIKANQIEELKNSQSWLNGYQMAIKDMQNQLKNANNEVSLN